MIGRDDLAEVFGTLLQSDRVADYGPNGLQVEGRPRVRRIVSGVTASLALIEAAVDAGADALLVHHGLFWRGQDGRLTGWLRQRVARLIEADVSRPVDLGPTGAPRTPHGTCHLGEPGERD